MDSYGFLLDLAIILISTKALGLLTRRFQLPQVVGALLAGLILGPAGFGLIHSSSFLTSVAEIGVIVLMFSAGLETDVQELKKSGAKAFVIALMGVLVPLAGGFLVAELFAPATDRLTLLQNIFVGVVLTATSVSISVETLKELGKLNTHSGNAILGAALIDDLLGIIALTIATSFAEADASLALAFLKIAGFFVFCLLCGFLIVRFLVPWINRSPYDFRRFGILAFAICLIMAYLSERLFGVSDITGAFISGLLLSSTKKTSYILSKLDTLSFLLLSPVFFASVGLKVTLSHWSAGLIPLIVILTLVACLTKVVGCGLGAKICRYTNLQVAKIGIGMISRGEVALIVAAKGLSLGLLKNTFYAPLLIAVVATTIITPVLLKLIYRYQAQHDVPVASALVNHHEEKRQLELAAGSVLEQNEALSHPPATPSEPAVRRP